MCRKSGLDERRHCRWRGESPPTDGMPVWVRGDLATSVCPKSLLSGESEALLEEFWGRRRFGGVGVERLTARQADAFAMLGELLREENKRG